jgi:hypothetical protein
VAVLDVLPVLAVLAVSLSLSMWVNCGWCLCAETAAAGTGHCYCYHAHRALRWCIGLHIKEISFGGAGFFTIHCLRRSRQAEVRSESEAEEEDGLRGVGRALPAAEGEAIPNRRRESVSTQSTSPCFCAMRGRVSRCRFGRCRGMVEGKKVEGGGG